MIKILHVISDTNIGGAGVHLCNLLACADRTQFDVTVVIPQGSALIPRIAVLDIPTVTIRHGADRSADLRAVPELIAVIRRIHPHILHTHSALYARIAGWLCRVPVAVNTRHCADMTAPTAPKTRLAVGFSEHLLNTHTIATAHYVKGILVKQGHRPQEVTVIHNGSLPVPRLTDAEKKQIRAELGIEDGAFVIGIVARLAEGKGHETFLRAAKLCLDEASNLRFLIVGNGEKEGELKTMAQELGIADQVRFLGFRTDVGRIMNILAINVNCSRRSETSSLSLSEGMCVGAVPVVTDCGGNPFMAGLGACGFVFPVENADRLAEVLLSLSRDKTRLATLSASCQRHFSTHFTAEGMTTKTELLYKTLLQAATTSPKIAK